MKKSSLFVCVSFVFLLTSCSDFFQPRVPMDFDSSNAYLEDLLVEEKKGGKLGTPSQLIASKNKEVDSIDLTWSNVKNAISYRIEYAIVSPDGNGNYPTSIKNEQFNLLEKSWYGNKYTHKITSKIVPDYSNRYQKRYFYRVTAINPREGYEDSEPTSNDIYGTLLAPPTNVKASAAEDLNFINVSWDFVDGAARYQIFRTDNETGAAAGFIKTIEGNRNQFKDYGISQKDKGKEFYYIIYAENNLGVMSEPSAIAMGYTLVPGAPPKPTGVKITSGRGDSPDKIVLRWNKVNSSDPIVYNVYRYSSKDSSLTKVGRDLTTTEFANDKQLETNIYYNYVVQAVAKPEGQEPLKSPMSVPVEGYILSPPENIKAKNVGDKVKLTWSKALGNEEEQKTYTYKILGSNKQDGVYKELSIEAGTSCTVDSFAFYKIKTVKNNSIESKDSELTAPPPEGVTNISVSQADYSVVGDSQLANSQGVYPVKISWEQPNDENAVGYYVYRSMKPDSDFRRITNEAIHDLNYFDADDTLQPGKVYYYKVLSLNVLDIGENYSPIKYGWGALNHKTYLKQFNETIISSQKKLTLMHKPGSTDKLGTESKKGTISGTISYDAHVQGIGARILMNYSNYADFYIDPNNINLGIKFVLNGDSNTTANMSSNGTMDGVINCTGMYPGKVDYSQIEIKAGAAGGGVYIVTPLNFTTQKVDFSVLEEK